MTGFEDKLSSCLPFAFAESTVYVWLICVGPPLLQLRDVIVSSPAGRVLSLSTGLGYCTGTLPLTLCSSPCSFSLLFLNGAPILEHSAHMT